MSDQNRTVVSRGRALKTGGLAALSAGLLSGLTTAPVAADRLAAAPTLATVVNFPDLVAEPERLIAQYERERGTYHVLSDGLRSTLSEGQQDLLRETIDAFGNMETIYNELTAAEMARHAPGLAPVIWLLWHHVLETFNVDLARCCTSELTTNA